MNLKCLICRDLFTPSSEIHTTHCGHLFHYVCLSQWLERSRTCPQCRTKVTEKCTHKVYLNVDEDTEGTDTSTLQFKLDNAQFQLTLKSKDIQNLKDKYAKANRQNEGLRSEVKALEDQIRIINSALDALKEQISYFKTRSKDTEKLREEVKRLKIELENLDNVRTVITGSREQVNDMLRHNNDPQSLSILVTTLKKELIDSNKKAKQFQSLAKETKNELRDSKQNLAHLIKLKAKLEENLEAHGKCESERLYLKRKIQDMQSEVSSPSHANSSIRRIIKESPAPLEKIHTQDKLKSPSVLDKVSEIKESNSPYLQIQASSIGLTGLMNNLNKTGKNVNIFKPPFNSQSAKQPSREMVYDGLGGHSKDEIFPSPISVLSKSLKRSRTLSTITSAKFRKLAPNQRSISFDKS